MGDSLELWSVERIHALAPDDQVRQAAEALALAPKWHNTGRQANVIWGEHQGSGANPYRVAVDLDAPAFKCTCPSRKQPCKHALGLFLAAQSSPKILRNAAEPDWVKQWLANRQAAAARQAKPQADKPADERAQAKRAYKREQRVEQGMQALTLWLDDLMRQGLGGLAAQPHAFWETQAARLVDAQAPGLARRVRELETTIHTRTQWQAHVLDRLSRIYLLVEAYQRVETLTPEMQAEVRTQIGWSQDQASLRGQPGVRDEWAVVGVREAEEERLRIRRTWLWGLQSHRSAVVVEFAMGGQAFETVLPAGMVLSAELVFWPGAIPQRALVKQVDGKKRLETLSGYRLVRDALADWSHALACSPWIDYALMPLENVIPVRREESWVVCDAEKNALPLTVRENDGWRLLALSGGRPITLIGEWDGETLTPLSLLSSLVPGLAELENLRARP